MSTPAQCVESTLPAGRWRVDEQAGELAFKVKTMWGLSTVKGRFERYGGELAVTPEGTSGKLHIEASSLSTKNSMRDNHLRSADFFDVEHHPNVSFQLSGAKHDGSQLTVAGELEVAGKPVQLEFPVKVERLDGDRLRLAGEVTVTRTQAGLTWNRVGMIGDVAQLSANVVLVPDATARTGTAARTDTVNAPDAGPVSAG
jgi:polyisoprenoid-binding protein YceI